MLVVRATKKLLDRIRTPVLQPGEESTTWLGQWYATALFWRPQVALLVNETSLLPVLMPLAPAATLPTRAASSQVSPTNPVDATTIGPSMFWVVGGPPHDADAKG